MMLLVLLVYKADAWLKQNMSCCSVNSFDFALEKLHSRWSARAFFPRKIERINRPTKHVFLQNSTFLSFDNKDIFHIHDLFETLRFWDLERFILDGLYIVLAAFGVMD